MQPRSVATAHVARGVEEATGWPFLHRSGCRQTHCVGIGDVDHAPGGADSRRHGLFERDAAGAVFPRCEDHGNLRGHERDPTARHFAERDWFALTRKSICRECSLRYVWNAVKAAANVKSMASRSRKRVQFFSMRSPIRAPTGIIRSAKRVG